MAYLDALKQYQCRDCLKITGIPVIPSKDLNILVTELCSAFDVNIEEKDICIAHRLPSTKKVNDRLIVKFVRRVKRDEVYKPGSKLNKNKTTCLTSINAKFSKGVPRVTKIYTVLTNL